MFKPTHISQKSLSGKALTLKECLSILDSSHSELLSLITAAYEVRQKYFNKEVLIHILNNVQNGNCSQDCQYCAQSRLSQAPINAYTQKPAAEIFAEAEQAYRSGAFRHCLVFSGERLNANQFEQVVNIVHDLKAKYPMEICISPGFINQNQAHMLKAAGLDRINHNLNTSRRNYPNICTTHTYDDRLNTLTAAKSAGLQICSGAIIGMGENTRDIIDMAMTLRKIKAESIPVNFFLPIPGVRLESANALTPDFCLRVLCLFRFLNPKADIRVAAGREYHLRSLETLALYPANSLFLDGYLNAQGKSRVKTLQMIKDNGFTIRSEHGLDELLKLEDRREKGEGRKKHTPSGLILKSKRDLRQHS